MPRLVAGPTFRYLRPMEQLSRTAALEAWEAIVLPARAHLAAGGNLHTKGSGGWPKRLRTYLDRVDRLVPFTLASDAAMALPVAERIREHVMPMKRIAIEIIDPSACDPRANTRRDAIAGGPARDAQHMEEIALRLIRKAWVTREEHRRLNLAGASFQWDAPDGDGLERYRRAGVEVREIN